MMNYENIEKAFEEREIELRSLGFAGEFDGPVSAMIQDDLLADFRKDLAKTLEEMKQQTA
jgi:hypothetical protein